MTYKLSNWTKQPGKISLFLVHATHFIYLNLNFPSHLIKLFNQIYWQKQIPIFKVELKCYYGLCEVQRWMFSLLAIMLEWFIVRNHKHGW